MIGKLKKMGVEFKPLENDYNLDIPENLIPYILNLALPQVENERRGLNTKAGMRQAMREGRWMGTPPRGYTGKNACFDQSSPKQSDHLTPLILKKVGWEIKIDGGWSS